MITKETVIKDIVLNYSSAVPVLLELGVHCLGCGMSGFETVEQGLKGHGLSDEQVDEAVLKMNEALKVEK